MEISTCKGTEVDFCDAWRQQKLAEAVFSENGMTGFELAAFPPPPSTPMVLQCNQLHTHHHSCCHYIFNTNTAITGSGKKIGKCTQSGLHERISGLRDLNLAYLHHHPLSQLAHGCHFYTKWTDRGGGESFLLKHTTGRAVDTCLISKPSPQYGNRVKTLIRVG